MRRSLKQPLLRSSAIATCFATAAVGMGSPAYAAVISNPQSLEASGSPSFCQVRIRTDRTGTQDDTGNGVDQFVVGLRDPNTGQFVAGPNFTTVPNGQTVTNVTAFQNITPNSRGPLELAFVEANGSALGQDLFVIPVPRSLLVSSGGGCPLVAENNAPTADAGADQNLPSNSATATNVVIDASASSDLDGDALSFQWTQISGPQATITSANQANASLSLPAVATPTVFEFEVIVTDAALESATDTVRITLMPLTNIPPTVDAGPDQNITGGASVVLSGTAADADSDPLTYQWAQTGGPSVTLTGDTTLTPSFTAPPRAFSAQALTFELSASDGTVSTTDTVTLTVAANQGPVADAGQPQTIVGGSSVALDATASSDPEGDPLIYNWTQASGPSVTLTGANTTNPTFTAPVSTNSQQALEFEVRVTDSFDVSDTARVTISIPANQLPLADAGPDQSVTGNSTVTLDGSDSTDPEGDQIFYTWVQTGGPSVILNSANTANPFFDAPAGTSTSQTLTFQLTVTDDDGSGIPGGARVAPPNQQQDTVEITILANSPPVADAGADQGPIDSGQTVTLDGSGSSDPDNDTLTYTWTQISGTPVSLTGSSSVSPTFVAPLVNGNEDLVFSLIVSDGQIDSVADTVTINVRAVGTVTIIQRVLGGDTPVTFTSSIAALNGVVTTTGGSGQLSAQNVAAGSYTVEAADLTGNGFAITDITCNDADSSVNIAARSVALELSPGEDLVCTFTSVNSRDAATSAIADFLTGRNALIMSHQPDLQRRLDRLDGALAQPGNATAYGVPVPGSGALPFSMNVAKNQARASTSLGQVRAATGGQDRLDSPFDVWGEAFFTSARLGDQKANFRIFHLGADYKLGNNLLLGALAEFDDFDDRDDLEAGEAEGNGWLIGPYVMARIAPELFAELRAGWGKSENRVSPLGSYVDEFDTTRSYYSGSLVGQFDLGKDTQIRPEMTIRYLNEDQKAYTDSLNVIIPGQSVNQGDISFRPRIHHQITLDSGWIIRPFGEVEGIYTFGTTTNSILENGVRARVEGGLDFLAHNGFRASLGAFHDGVGAENFSSSGAHVSLSFGF